MGLVGYAAAVDITVYDAQLPQFLSISNSGSTVRVKVRAIAEVPHVLEASADLESWIPLSTNTPSGTELEFDLESSAAAQFYRVSTLQ
jgi:hypothetical protein